jgi:uncharacterized protein YjbJ (UPF0337 family)
MRCGGVIEESIMNADILKGKWLQLKGSVKERWGQLTNDEVDRVSGNAEHLVGLLQERYGYEKERAQREVNDFLASYDKTTVP